MTYAEAAKWREENLDRVGSTDEKGFIVDDLLIVPAENPDRDNFLSQYIQDVEASVAIIPFMNDNMQVWAVDTRHLKSTNVLFFNILIKE